MAPETYDVIVVGGGAAGLMAAGRAAECGSRVLLIEKNKRLGEKIRISGGGRCNITNAEKDERVLLKAYGNAEQFLYSVFSQFGVTDTFAFFTARGLPLVIEARKRAFPVTENALDVVDVLEKYVAKGSVTVRTGMVVTEVLGNRSGITGVVCGKHTYTAARYIFATGSVSHPETGSTGDGFLWLAKLGHTIIQPTPTIVPIKTQEKWSKVLSGTSLSDMKITFAVDEKKSFSKTGKILFTHFGLSGPLILNSAGAISDLLQEGTVTASIDMFPKDDQGSLERRLIAAFDANKNKALKNVLREVLPEGMTKGIVKLLEGKIDESKKVHSVTREERTLLVRLLKNVLVTVSGLMGFDRAVIADGGVPLIEINMKTMQSKKIPNLYIIGDLLHVQRPSGGYSLQLCWSTGYVAGTCAAT